MAIKSKEQFILKSDELNVKNLGVLNPLQPCNYAHKLYFLEFKLLL